MAASLEDVARSAGVSVATVSRVFNARPNVADDTRAAVAAAIERLGYGGQQRLAADRHRLVGVVVSDPESTLFADIARSLADALAVHGVSVMVLRGTDADPFDEQAVEIFLERRVSGVVFLGGQRSSMDLALVPYLSLRNGSIAVVAVGGGGESLNGAAMTWDDSMTMRVAMDRLLADGHRSIGYIARRNNWVSVQNRMEAFLCAISDAAVSRPTRGMVERSSSTIENAELVAHNLLDAGATAILCETDWMTIGALRAVRASGRHVPTDVALISCEDSRVLAELDPPVTAIRQPVEALGRAAASELLRQLEGLSPQLGQQRFLPEIVIRESTAIAGNTLRPLRR